MSNESLADLESNFTALGPFMERKGRAWKKDGHFCNKKLCFVATDKSLLVKLLRELSDDPVCFYVKYSAEAKDGMYLGRCFLTDPLEVGRAWNRFKSHPRLMCSVQDDDFTLLFRPEDMVALARAREAARDE